MRYVLMVAAMAVATPASAQCNIEGPQDIAQEVCGYAEFARMEALGRFAELYAPVSPQYPEITIVDPDTMARGCDQNHRVGCSSYNVFWLTSDPMVSSGARYAALKDLWMHYAGWWYGVGEDQGHADRDRYLVPIMPGVH